MYPKYRIKFFHYSDCFTLDSLDQVRWFIEKDSLQIEFLLIENHSKVGIDYSKHYSLDEFREKLLFDDLSR